MPRWSSTPREHISSGRDDFLDVLRALILLIHGRVLADGFAASSFFFVAVRSLKSCMPFNACDAVEEAYDVMPPIHKSIVVRAADVHDLGSHHRVHLLAHVGDGLDRGEGGGSISNPKMRPIETHAQTY